MFDIISFITSVTAKVVAYYVCKWLDRLFKAGNKPR